MVSGIHKHVNLLKLNHHTCSSYEKSITEETIQYIKDRSESFGDNFPYPQKVNCKLEQVKNWFSVFVDIHNDIHNVMIVFAK